MPLEFDQDRELEHQGLEILDQVVVETFEIDPQTIRPFEEAQLSWEVTSPDQRFHVRLQGATVAKVGSATVSPLRTTC